MSFARVDTVTPEETSISTGSFATGIVAVLLTVALSLPGLVVPVYAHVVGTVLLVVGVIGAIRILVSVVVATVPRDPPTDLRTDLPPVSLVVTAYNEADVLSDTIEACRNVDYPDDRLEVIVGYEADSTDATAAIATAAAADDARVTAMERTASPGGKASATNHALSAATGEIIGVLDADQQLEPGAVHRAVRWFEDESVSCVKGRCLGRNPDASLIALCATVERSIIERTEFVARDRLGGFRIFTGGQAFFRAGTLERVGEFDESILLEDLDMAYCLQRAGDGVRVDPGIVTREINPAGFSAWWNQRKRWARGGMQIARRYLDTTLLSGPPSLRARADFALTLGVLVVLPVLVCAAPLVVVAWNGIIPASIAGWLWGLVLLTPIISAYATFALDAKDGYRHDVREYGAPLLLWPYIAVQAVAVVVSFIEEFVLRRPPRYVTSAMDTERT